MKSIYLIIGLILFTGLQACSEEEQEKPKKEEAVETENLVEIKDGIYYEWYPGKKQVKYKGPQDENKMRHGIWNFYSENGVELSVTMYNHGKKEGYTIVKYPNGTLHYRGEYLNDEMVGLWTTYDEKGNIISEKDFGQPK